jgi:hypothetical protein
MSQQTYPTVRFINRLAERISGAGLGPVAIFMLELQKPLSFIGSQAVLLGQPLLDSFLPSGTTSQLAALLADRDHLERLIDRIDTLSRAARSGASAAPTRERS